MKEYAKGADLNSVYARLPCCFSKGLEKGDFLDIYLTTVFRVRNFENTSAMRVIFLYEVFENFSYISKMLKKSSESVFHFRDNWISLASVKLPLLKREYF